MGAERAAPGRRQEPAQGAAMAGLGRRRHHRARQPDGARPHRARRHRLSAAARALSQRAVRVRRQRRRLGAQLDPEAGVRARPAGRRAAPARGDELELSERPCADLGRRLSHARRPADAHCRRPPGEVLLHRHRDVRDVPGRAQPGVPWRTLPERRRGGLAHRHVVGAAVLGRRADARAPRRPEA